MDDTASLLSLADRMLWVTALAAAPILLATLAIGLVVGVIQAATSVNEQTLTFVPKVGAMLAVFWVSMTFMSGALVAFFTDRIIPLIAGG